MMVVVVVVVRLLRESKYHLFSSSKALGGYGLILKGMSLCCICAFSEALCCFGNVICVYVNITCM